MSKNTSVKKLDDLFNKTIDSDVKYDGKLNNIDFFSAICKATTNDLMIKFQGSNLSMFNYRYEKEDSVLMIFSLPISNDNYDNNNKQKKKHITERIMNIIKILENYFVTLDYVDCNQVKEEKFSHLTVVKKINKKNQN